MVDANTQLGPAMFVTPDRWKFEPLEDGAVRITTPHDGPIDVPRDLWAEMVATVSWAGQTPERVEKAFRFHYGTDSTPNPATELEGHEATYGGVDPGDVVNRGGGLS